MQRTKIKPPTRRAPAPKKKERRLTKSTIAAWARAYRARSGDWPTLESGPIPEAPGETWARINAALMFGSRGLPGGSCLEELLSHYRVNPRPLVNKRKLRLTESQILGWAKEHYDRTGRWPYQHAGIIPGAGGLTWLAVDGMLRGGWHGLPGGSSLTVLLRKRRGSARNCYSTPLTKKLILKWADAHHERTGEWPTDRSGPIPESPGTTWQAVMTALHSGYRGFRGGVTLGQFLAEHRGAPLRRKRSGKLTIAQILEWVDAHHDRTGEWPIRSSGTIQGTDGETWEKVCVAMFNGGRGLPKTSLAKLLAERRGVRNRRDLPPLSCEQILEWADEHFRRTGTWPTRDGGAIPGTNGETWERVYGALYQGLRGLTGRVTLSALLQRERGVAR